MKRGKFENRAKQLSLKKTAEIMPEISQQQYWTERVRTKSDVAAFYKIYYPHFPEVLSLSIADYFEKILTG